MNSPAAVTEVKHDFSLRGTRVPRQSFAKPSGETLRFRPDGKTPDACCTQAFGYVSQSPPSSAKETSYATSRPCEPREGGWRRQNVA
jgi:hypothetical protein